MGGDKANDEEDDDVVITVRGEDEEAAGAGDVTAGDDVDNEDSRDAVGVTGSGRDVFSGWISTGTEETFVSFEDFLFSGGERDDRGDGLVGCG